MTAAGAALGLLLDRAVGEVPVEPHPVAAFGDVMAAAEARWWADDRAAGVVHAGLGVGIGAAAGIALDATWAATWLAASGRLLGTTAAAVGDRLRSGDLAGARRGLPALVGRDPAGLDEGGITRAVVESVAENAVDAVVAPALWGAVAGAPGTLAHRAVNTLDAMVGHRSARHERFGWASARLDDAANLVPARATALLVAAVRPERALAVARAVGRDAPAHPSPNAGVAEAAFAAALDLRLGGVVAYGGRHEDRGTLGRGRPPDVDDIDRAVALLDDVTLALVGALAGVGALRRRARRRRRGPAGRGRR